MCGGGWARDRKEVMNFLLYILEILILTLVYCWRASKTLTGVTQLKIRDMSLFIYTCGRTYVILYFDPHVFLCLLCV